MKKWSPKLIDKTGMRFEALIVEKYLGKAKWRCKCDCGEYRDIFSTHIGKQHSCGCLTKKIFREKRQTHGMTNTTEWNIWHGLKQRCLDKNHGSFPKYGGRGIMVCERWKNSFENFYADMGPRPSKQHSLDRINNDGNYEPSNCRWATRKEQSRNKTNSIMCSIDGENIPLIDACEKLGVYYPMVLERISKGGWDKLDALYTPKRTKKKKKE